MYVNGFGVEVTVRSRNIYISRDITFKKYSFYIKSKVFMLTIYISCFVEKTYLII